MKLETQSFLWRTYAIVFVLLAGIQRTLWMITHGSALGWLATLVILCACFGVTTWAFGYRIGPARFWKCISGVLVIALLYGLYPSFSSLTDGKAGHWSGNWIAALVTAIPLYGIACFALLRAGTQSPPDATARGAEDMPTPPINGRLDRLKARTTPIA